jgi:hypothetical protein
MKPTNLAQVRPKTEPKISPLHEQIARMAAPPEGFSSSKYSMTASAVD